MTLPSLSRRQFAGVSASLLGGGAAVASLPQRALAAVPVRAESARSEAEPFGYCFNTSTVRGQGLKLVDEVRLAGEAGYHAIEPWIRELDQYVKEGGSLSDLRKRIEDAGLTVESAIGFAEWIVDDDEKRAKGLDEAKRNVEMLREIGGKRLAAPPVGATKQTDLNLTKAGQRYGDLCQVCTQFGIAPQVEVWGFSTSLGRLSESTFVALESRHPQACILPDIYHLHRGGSGFETLKLLSNRAIHVFHVNDYPAEPEAPQLTDAHRVYPGDGVAPLKQIFRDLRDIGYRGYLSLELFNRDYWAQDAAEVMKTGLRKTRESVQKALS